MNHEVRLESLPDLNFTLLRSFSPKILGLYKDNRTEQVGVEMLMVVGANSIQRREGRGS